MDLLERRRMMMSAGGGWKTYTLTDHTFPGTADQSLDTGLELYKMSEWELKVVFTATSSTSLRVVKFGTGSYNYTLNVTTSSARIILSGSIHNAKSTDVSAVNNTLTLTASWKAGVEGSATLTGTGVNLSVPLLVNSPRDGTLNFFTPVGSTRPTGTIHSLTIRYKE